MTSDQIRCANCGKTDYHDHPGPWFPVPFYGWFCSTECWSAQVKQRIDFETLIKGLPSDDIVSVAIECGYLENKNFQAGDEARVPYWLAQILAKQRIIEIV